MIRYGWICVRVCKHIAPWMIGAYAAVHPLKTACELHCHLAIPPYEWQRGGMFWGYGNGNGYGSGYGERLSGFAGSLYGGAYIGGAAGGSIVYGGEGTPYLVPPVASQAPPNAIVPIDVPEPPAGLTFAGAVLILIGLHCLLRNRNTRK